MPIFEFICGSCSHPFEAFIQGSGEPRCPSCGGTELEKQLSVFAVSGGSGGKEAPAPVAPCGSCGDPRGPGACSIS